MTFFQRLSAKNLIPWSMMSLIVFSALWPLPHVLIPLFPSTHIICIHGHCIFPSLYWRGSCDNPPQPLPLATLASPQCSFDMRMMCLSAFELDSIFWTCACIRSISAVTICTGMSVLTLKTTDVRVSVSMILYCCRHRMAVTSICSVQYTLLCILLFCEFDVPGPGLYH